MAGKAIPLLLIIINVAWSVTSQFGEEAKCDSRPRKDALEMDAAFKNLQGSTFDTLLQIYQDTLSMENLHHWQSVAEIFSNYRQRRRRRGTQEFYSSMKENRDAVYIWDVEAILSQIPFGEPSVLWHIPGGCRVFLCFHIPGGCRVFRVVVYSRWVPCLPNRGIFQVCPVSSALWHIARGCQCCGIF